MIDTTEFSKLVAGQITPGARFTPTQISATGYSPEPNEDYDVGEVQSPILDKQGIDPRSTTKQIVAIDSTRMLLGEIPDGIVGAVRASIITDGTTRHRGLEHHGAYIFPITSQNSKQFYSRVYSGVYGQQPSSTPILSEILDHVRNLLERYVQLEVVRNFKDSLILFDGSLIAGTVGSPTFFLDRILQTAQANNNAIAAISKMTQLTFAGSRSNILTIASNAQGPCYFGDIRRFVTRDPSRYLGEIYVAKLSTSGRTFRVDIPSCAMSPHEVLCTLSSYVGDDGYSEDLRLAHMTCIFSSIEVMELQAAAITMFNMTLADNIRDTLFPFP
jgi:hypothetical protein